VPAARRRLERWLDLRYVGQNFELLVPVPDETWRDGDCAALHRRFFATHEQVYGFAAEDEPVQVVNVRGRPWAGRPAQACTAAAGRPDRRRPRARRGVHAGEEGLVACECTTARLLAGTASPARGSGSSMRRLPPPVRRRVDDLGSSSPGAEPPWTA
jgi:N-methylhydantoinase A